VRLREVVFLNDDERETFPEVTWPEQLLRKEIRKLNRVKGAIKSRQIELEAQRAAAAASQAKINELTSKVAAMGELLEPEDQDF